MAGIGSQIFAFLQDNVDPGWTVAVAGTATGVYLAAKKIANEYFDAFVKNYLSQNKLAVAVVVVVGFVTATTKWWLPAILAAVVFSVAVFLKTFRTPVAQRSMRGLTVETWLLCASLAAFGAGYAGGFLWARYRYNTQTVIAVLPPKVGGSIHTSSATQVQYFNGFFRRTLRTALQGIERIEVLPVDETPEAYDALRVLAAFPPNDSGATQALVEFRSQTWIPITFEVFDSLSANDEQYIEHQTQALRLHDETLRSVWPAVDARPVIHRNDESDAQRAALVAVASLMGDLFDDKLNVRDAPLHVGDAKLNFTVAEQAAAWRTLGAEFQKFLQRRYPNDDVLTQAIKGNELASAIRAGTRTCDDRTCVEQMAALLAQIERPKVASSGERAAAARVSSLVKPRANQ